MRTVYITPSVQEFETILAGGFRLSRGGKLDDIRYLRNPHTYQRGSGILSFLSGIARKTIPFLFQHVLPEAGTLFKNVSADLNQGRSLKNALKRHGTTALKNVGKRVIGGKNKKKNKCKLPKKRVVKVKDVFSRV